MDVAGEAERSATRALIRAVVGGLNSGERGIITQLRHGFDVTEVAAMLGVSRNHAYSLFSRARDQLETSVGVLLVGQAASRAARPGRAPGHRRGSGRGGIPVGGGEPPPPVPEKRVS